MKLATDVLLAALVRWLQEEDCMPPEQFLRMLKFIIMGISNDYVGKESTASEA